VKKKPHQKAILQTPSAEYGGLIGGIAELLETARRTAARTVNALMTATYWEIGRRIVEFEQGGEKRAEYGEALLQRLAQDLNAKFGRGFSYPNVNKFRQFYLAFPSANILSTPSIESTESILSTPSIELRRQKKPDTVWPIGSAQSLCAFSFAMVALRSAALREKRTRA
jgi:hypothetical protein